MKTVVVAALGPSIASFVPLRDRADIVVGVNDIDRWLIPDDLICTDQARRFTGDRAHYINNTRAKCAWLLHAWPTMTVPERHKIRIQSIARGEVGGMLPILDTDKLCTAHTTVVPAIHLAYRLGATRIGVVGCDLLAGHNLATMLGDIDHAIGRLRMALAARGVELVNLSPVSALASLEKREMEAWLDAQ